MTHDLYYLYLCGGVLGGGVCPSLDPGRSEWGSELRGASLTRPPKAPSLVGDLPRREILSAWPVCLRIFLRCSSATPRLPSEGPPKPSCRKEGGRNILWATHGRSPKRPQHLGQTHPLKGIILLAKKGVHAHA